MELKPLTDLVNMSGDQAIAWILDNQFDYSLVRTEDVSSQFEPLVMQLLADITENELLVRPSLVGGWWVSKWKGITGLNEAYCTGVIGEGKTILEAVNDWKMLSKHSA